MRKLLLALLLLPALCFGQQNKVRNADIINGTIRNPKLLNDSIIINGTTCPLGSTQTITAAPSGTAAGDLAGTYPNPTIKSSVALSGSPTTTTQAAGDNSTKIATTANLNWELISTITASSNATVDFTGLSAAYSMYIVIMNNVVPQTNGTFLSIRLGTGAGPTWGAGASDYAYAFTTSATGGTGVGSAVTGYAIGTGTGQTMNAQVEVYNPSQSTLYHGVLETISIYSNTNTQINGVISGTYLSTTAVTGIRFICGSGNVNAGTFRLYGVK